MKKIYMMLALALGCFGLTGCLDNVDEPNVEDFIITSPTSLGKTNTTIYELKLKFSNEVGENNSFTQVPDTIDDIIFEGVVIGNDDGGNLYQTLVIRDLGGEEAGSLMDQCIQIGIRNTWLSPYFKRGQRIKVKLNGLWIGNYSKTPKVGTPYYTSAGNKRLGPMLLQDCKTHIELIGKPDANAPELIPFDCTEDEGLSWLADKDNQDFMNSPRLVTVKGTIDEVQGDNLKRAAFGELSGEKEPNKEAVIDPATGEQKIDPATGEPVYNYYKIFAPKELYDAGYAVDRTISISGQSKLKVTLRTSTQNDISYLHIPADERSYTGIITFYDGWQMQLRHKNDIYPQIDSKSEGSAER